MATDMGAVPAFRAEFAAAGSPQAEFRDALARQAEASASAARIDSVQAEIDEKQANLRFLQGVAGILPAMNYDLVYDPRLPYDQGAFEIPRGDDEYRLTRTIQTNVIWWPSKTDNPYPYYVIGKRVDRSRPNEMLLMLLPAAGDPKARYRPIFTSLLKDEANAYFDLMQRRDSSEYTAASIDRLVDKRTGHIVIGPQSPGSINWSYQKRKPASQDHIARKGELNFRGREVIAWQGISSVQITAYDVENTVAKLVSSLGLDDKYAALLNPDVAQEPEADAAKLVGRLRDQCEELRQTLATVLKAGGVLPPDQVDASIAERFPTL